MTLTITGTDQANLSGMRGTIPSDPEVPQTTRISSTRLDGAAARDVPGDDVDGTNTETIPLPVAAMVSTP